MKHKIFDKYLADILKVFRIEEKDGVNYNYDIHKVNILRGIKNAQKLVDSDDDFFKVMKRIEDSTFI